MTTNVRNGLVLVAVAAAFFLVSLAASAEFAQVARGAAILFAIAGLILTAVGLARQE